MPEYGARTLQTRDRRQTDGRRQKIANMNMSSRSLKMTLQDEPIAHGDLVGVSAL